MSPARGVVCNGGPISTGGIPFSRASAPSRRTSRTAPSSRAFAAERDVQATYHDKGWGHGMAAVFPSHHGGFLGGEFGQSGEPEAFAARLREVLDSR